MQSRLITSSSFSSDVFLSFRGEDTRNNFISHLQKALRDKQIKTYNDDQLNSGDDIFPSLFKAIEESKISVIVFSEGYASSTWCLKELGKILECRANYGQIVIPVFYGLDPSVVCNQTGCYAEAFARHEQRFKQSLDKVQRWKDALKEVANISGFESCFLKESVLVDDIVDDVLKKLNHMSLSYDEDLFGIDPGIEQTENWLKRGDVRSATSLIISPSFSSNHHVFLSFRGKDTRNNFISHLEKALHDKQIKTYNDLLYKGDDIFASLLKAIEESKISVIVFSKDYASSRWCLDELVKILECRENYGQIVIPVFYKVDPSDLRCQTGCYADAFAKHQQRFKQSLDKVQRWKDALEEAGCIPGFDSRFLSPESVLIDNIVNDVLKKLNKDLVGIDSGIEQIEYGLKRLDVCSVGIGGIGGIGKTTHAQAVSRKISCQFDRSCQLDKETKRFKISKNYWRKGDFLGRGSFGSVYEGISDDGFFFAVKEVSLLDQGSEESIYQLEQEIALLSQFEHENIVQYFGTDKDESKLYIFLELVTKGSLLNLYRRYHLPDSQVSAYTRQILHGLKYLHDRNVVHRDIKCANILVDASGNVKIADFGMAKATKLNDIKSCKGTPFWMAPEVVNNKKQGYGIQADIWSLGCTVLEMLTRQIPYSHLERMQALFQIGKGVPPRLSEHLSEDAREFILKCLQTNPSDRPTAAQLLDHPFLNRPLPTFSGSPSPRPNLALPCLFSLVLEVSCNVHEISASPVPPFHALKVQSVCQDQHL